MPPKLTWLNDRDFELDGWLFHCGYPPTEPVPDGALRIMKTPAMIAPYLELVGEREPRHVVELGIRRGGSTAFLHAIWRPHRLVAVELDVAEAKDLTDYVDRRGAHEHLRPHYGIDQADADRLATILHHEFGDDPIDVVVDDASHEYGATLASFELLFPRLRPGGRYIIEDWASGHKLLDNVGQRILDATPDEVEQLVQKMEGLDFSAPNVLLSQLTMELVLAKASAGDLIRDVMVTSSWTVITRGEDQIDPDGFRLRDHYRLHMRYFDQPPTTTGP